MIYQILCNPQQYGHYAQAETNADKRLLLQQKLGLVKKTAWYIKQPSNQNDALVTLALNHSGNKTPTISKKFQCYLQTHSIWGVWFYWDNFCTSNKCRLYNMLYWDGISVKLFWIQCRLIDCKGIQFILINFCVSKGLFKCKTSEH